ncbi:hypothetical protein EDB83DRAFT_1549559 [Lactarius deliciosus]|nr:hypothetical protein EDB83DRAFT_1549559 [Lactarius deliciosus]
MAWYILRQIRGVYISLHQDTDSAPIHVFPSTGNSDDLSEPSSYPVCSVASHIHDGSTSTTFARVVLHNNAAPAPASPSSPDAPSSTMPAPLHVGESPRDVPPLDNFHLSHQTNMEGVYIPATSPNPARVDVFVASGMTIPHTTPATSTSAPLSSTSLSTAVALQHNSDLLTPSNPVLNSTLPTESHRSLIVTIAPRNPPWSTSASYLDTVTEDNGSQKPGSHKENDALDPPR